MFGMTVRQTRCVIYAIFAVMVAVSPPIALGPLLFLLLMDFIGE